MSLDSTAASVFLVRVLLLFALSFATAYAGLPEVIPVSDSVPAGASIQVDFRNGPGNADDLIAIVPFRLQSIDFNRPARLEGETEGRLTFKGLPPGTYEVRFISVPAPHREQLVAKARLTVTGEWAPPAEAPAVTTSKDVYRVGEEITVHFEGAWIREQGDRMTLVPAKTHDSVISLGGDTKSLQAPDGSVHFAGRGYEGEWELRMVRGNKKEVVSRHRVSVGNPLAESNPELDGGTFAAAGGLAARCDILLAWAGHWLTKYEVPDRPERGKETVYRQAIGKPFTDPEFEPVFGAPGLTNCRAGRFPLCRVCSAGAVTWATNMPPHFLTRRRSYSWDLTSKKSPSNINI